MNSNASATPRFSVHQLVLIACVTAVTCILAPFSIPLPFSPVPVSLTNLVLYISIYLLGWKASTVSYVIYLLLGIVGLPVFSGFSGGIGKAAGPTGGYLLGFLFLTVIAGFFVEKWNGKRGPAAFGMVLGTAITYLFGTIWLCHQAGLSFLQGLAVGVLPYLIFDAAKIFIAILFAPALRARIQSAVPLK